MFLSFYTILYLSHPLTYMETFTEILPGERPRRGSNVRGVAKYDFGPVEGYIYISETAQDTTSGTIND